MLPLSSAPTACRLLLTLLAGALLTACVAAPPARPGVAVPAHDPAIRISGRSEGLGTEKVTLGWSGARVRLRFRDSAFVDLRLDDDSRANHIQIWVDGTARQKIRLDADDGVYRVADGLGPGEHTIEVVRATEGQIGLIHFRGFELATGAAVLPWPAAPERRIEFIGDSITCGYGVDVDDPTLHFAPATENFCFGYSGLTARALGADYLVVSRSGIGMLRNYDGPRTGSPDAMPSVYPYTFYLQRDRTWDPRGFAPDVICVNLGTNDFSTTGVDTEAFVAAYHTFLNMLLERYPGRPVVMLQGPMNTGPELRAALDQVRQRLSAETRPRVHFLALSAQGPLGFGADYHPNRAQSQVNSRELTAFLRELMAWH